MRLSDAYIGLLAHVRRFLRRPQGSYEEVRQRIDEMIEESRAMASAGGFAEADWREALFAVAAWIDEAMMTSDWSEAPRWKRDLLQRKHFNTTRAGVEFFTRLDALTRGQRGLREIYYGCLLFGFKGRYGTPPNPKALEALKQKHLEMLFDDPQDLHLDANTRLFPAGWAESATPEETRAARRFRVSPATAAWFGAPLLIVLVLYFTYHLVLTSMVSGFMAFIR